VTSLFVVTCSGVPTVDINTSVGEGGRVSVCEGRCGSEIKVQLKL
jgi:hypothetical protein